MVRLTLLNTRTAIFLDLLGIYITFLEMFIRFFRYENLESAIDACARMKHFDLDGNGKHITVDFTKYSLTFFFV